MHFLASLDRYSYHRAESAVWFPWLPLSGHHKPDCGWVTFGNSPSMKTLRDCYLSQRNFVFLEHSSTMGPDLRCSGSSLFCTPKKSHRARILTAFPTQLFPLIYHLTPVLRSTPTSLQPTLPDVCPAHQRGSLHSHRRGARRVRQGPLFASLHRGAPGPLPLQLHSLHDQYPLNRDILRVSSRIVMRRDSRIHLIILIYIPCFWF